VSAPEGSVLVGIGNPYRRDDGIGPALVAAVDRLGVPGVRLTCADGEPSELLDAWAGTRLAVVVDAVACMPAVPGRIHRTELTAPYGVAGDALADSPLASAAMGGASTHGLGVPDAIQLAAVLDRAPWRLVVLAVEAADLGFGTGLSGPVAACLPELTRAVLAEFATPCA
jgi:hydrogenase maturation protease